MGPSELGYTDVGDSLAEMKTRAAYRHLEYPYLYDGDTQAVAAKFGVAATPHIFVFDRDRKLRYEGRIDDNVERAARQDAGRAQRDRRAAGRPRGPRRAHGRVRLSHELALEAVRHATRRRPRSTAEPVTLEMAGADDLKKLRANGTGKLLLVNFWATWCGPCVTEFPDLEATYRMYRGRNFEFVTVSINDPEDQPQVLAFLQKRHASSPNLQFATSDTSGLQAAFDPLMPARGAVHAVDCAERRRPLPAAGRDRHPETAAGDSREPARRQVYPGLQAYWSSH